MEKAIEILENAHFNQFNEFCKLNRTSGQIKNFDRNLSALGTLERAVEYLRGTVAQ